MVARKFLLHHEDSNFDVEYDTDDGFEVFKLQLFSLTDVPPDKQKIFGIEDDRIVSNDSDLTAISDKLRLVSINDENPKLDSDTLKSDEELARMLQEEEDALMFQQFAVTEDNGQFEQRVRPYVDQILQYEDAHRQEAARKTVPVEKLEEKVLVALAKEGNLNPSKPELDHAFLLQLLFWFKQTFKWVNSPPCEGCGNETTIQGMGVANSSELAYGASRVELYRCNTCSRTTRFPRYNDPIKLLETKKGRCGEWANCFSLYCRSFGYDTRLILDFTDHVWAECYSTLLGRWMHLDPCEGIYDTPLLYEKGWNKKLNYTIALGKDGVCDVTKRYTRKWHEVLSRRTITTESSASKVLATITRELRRNLTSVISELEERDRNEVKELEKSQHSQENDSLSLPGRLSGDKEWRTLRSEIGSDSLSSSSCLVRATSAFDGTCLSKWEEPNGAKGCWLIYKAMGAQVYQLCSYELMSANDAPERDPKDWVVEGSDDGGSSWRVLDEQTCQTFDNRFQRKAYKVRLQGFLANVFRFWFLAVGNGQATSRFQIGSIDLYASSNVN